MGLKLRVDFLILAALGLGLYFPGQTFASSTQPNLQEMRARHEVELVKQQKQQQAAIFKKQRDELLSGYKSLMQNKETVYGQMKISEKDYKTAMAKFNKAKQQQFDIEGQMGQLIQNSAKIDKKQAEVQMQKLRDAQAKAIEDMKKFSKIQQDSYESMRGSDLQYRNFTAKEQILKQQIESVQRQLQFVISQP